MADSYPKIESTQQAIDALKWIDSHLEKMKQLRVQRDAALDEIDRVVSPCSESDNPLFALSGLSDNTVLSVYIGDNKIISVDESPYLS